MTTTTETQIIVRPASDALRAAGPAKQDADASTPSDIEEKPLTPASKKHLGDPEEAKEALASKKQAKDANEAKKTAASEKPASGTEAGRPSPASKKRSAAVATKKKKTSASLRPTRKTKKATASSKSAPKMTAVKKPTAKQLPTKKGPAKESPKTPKLPPKRTGVLLPGPHEEVSSESSDTDTTNPGLIDDGGPSASRNSKAPRASASSPLHPAKADVVTTPPQGRSPSADPSMQVDYEESESDKDHEAGEVEWSPPQIPVEQRVIHPGSPMSPKTVMVVTNAPEPWRRPCLVETTRPLAPGHHQRWCG
ncbi:hypothetical protein PR003_g13480 [Phytophthora rubi]|uniref:Uncharacterized protein n=1 Tax=Phytophthora rubi TaxID=129364 RepID=A0A6A4F234_9STRA|nr:hypothetical protein PR002_g15008 [Phytophthora rubi]KAE9334513.1 hypothetical protein PR003_g13480 [Phytophthora rubi]